MSFAWIHHLLQDNSVLPLFQVLWDRVVAVPFSFVWSKKFIGGEFCDAGSRAASCALQVLSHAEAQVDEELLFEEEEGFSTVNFVICSDTYYSS